MTLIKNYMKKEAQRNTIKEKLGYKKNFTIG